MRMFSSLVFAASVFLLPNSAAAYGGNLLYCGEAGDAEVYVDFDLFDVSLARHYVIIPGGYGGPPTVTELKSVPGTPNPVFTGGDISLNLENAGGTLNEALSTFTCTVADRTKLTALPQRVQLADITWNETPLNKPGKSWAGVLRAGPGMFYEKIASLKLDQTLTLLARTDIEMNGYEWYKVELDNGVTGYKWGGILCDPSGTETSTYNEDGCTAK